MRVRAAHGHARGAAVAQPAWDSDGPLMLRALTVRQAAELLRMGRLHASHSSHSRGPWSTLAARGGAQGFASDGSDDFSDGEVPPLSLHPQRLGSLGESHPISAPVSTRRPSDAGPSEAGGSVVGVPPLPARAPSAAASHKSQREAQQALQLLRELLQRDYAVGYLFLSWLLRTSWALLPAVAALLGLPNPTGHGACWEGDELSGNGLPGVHAAVCTSSFLQQ